MKNQSLFRRFFKLLKAHLGDTVLVLLLVILPLLISLLLVSARRQGAYAVVWVKGEAVARYDLEIDREIPIATDMGSNLLVIQNGYCYITEADCPDKLCTRQKIIRSTGQSIVCLPHHLSVTVEGKETDVDIAVPLLPQKED